MAQSMSATLREGQTYMHTWPMRKELYPLFPECRIIASTQLAIKTMPPVAVVSAIVLVSQFGTTYLPQALAVAAFFISLPLQGLFWLGHRSNQQLPPSTRQWYADIRQKLVSNGFANVPNMARPRYKELAATLKSAFDNLDKSFTQQLF